MQLQLVIFFKNTVTFAQANQIGVVHDFAYGAIGFDGHKPLSFLQTPGAKDVGIEMYTLSKSYNMAGWRIGFAVGNADMIEALNLIQDHLFVSVFPAIQKAAIAALQSDQSTVTDLVSLYQRRAMTFMQQPGKLAGNPTLQVAHSTLGCPFPKASLVKRLLTYYWKKPQ